MDKYVIKTKRTKEEKKKAKKNNKRLKQITIEALPVSTVHYFVKNVPLGWRTFKEPNFTDVHGSL